VGQALAGKVCEGWFLHDTITKVSAIVSEKVRPNVSSVELHDDAKNRLEKFGLLASQTKPQQYHSPSNDQSKISAWFWSIMQYGYLMYLFLRYVSRELPVVRQKSRHQQVTRISTSSPTLSVDGTSRTPNPDDQQTRPILAFGVYAMISTLLRVADRMPWLASMLIFMQRVLLVGAGQVGQLNSILDRYVVISHVACAAPSPSVLRLYLSRQHIPAFCILKTSFCPLRCMKLKSYDMSQKLAANHLDALTIEACAITPYGPPNHLEGCVGHLG